MSDLVTTDVVSSASSVILVLLAGVFVIFTWLTSSEEQKRKYIDDLVNAAQQRFLDEKTGPERMEFVLAEFKKRFPHFPEAVARNIAEAAVKRMKANIEYC